jgi:hypothetical protein
MALQLITWLEKAPGPRLFKPQSCARSQPHPNLSQYGYARVNIIGQSLHELCTLNRRKGTKSVKASIQLVWPMILNLWVIATCGHAS